MALRHTGAIISNIEYDLVLCVTHMSKKMVSNTSSVASHNKECWSIFKNEISEQKDIRAILEGYNKNYSSII